MNKLGIILMAGLCFGAAGCTKTKYAECGSPEAKKVIDKLFKEELEYSVQNELDSQKQLGSYDSTELEDAVQRLNISLDDVRTSRDDPDSDRYSCSATLKLDIPDRVEKEANETRAMAEMVNVRKLANRYKMKRKGQNYTTDFDYFIQPTDDGKKLVAELDDDAPSMKFLGEVLASYLLSDEIREEKIAQDQAEAAEEKKKRDKERAEQEREREVDEAFNAEASADLAAAKADRKLASDRIGAVWLAMPKDIQQQLDARHSSWVRSMKAKCKLEAAGTDIRKAKREAKELDCQTRLVRSCAKTLERNISRGRYNSQVYYCRFNR